MRFDASSLLGVLVGAVAAALFLLVLGAFDRSGGEAQVPVSPLLATPGTVRQAPQSPPVSPPSASRGGSAHAWTLLRTGRLNEAQDEFLQILLISAPGDQQAMAGLVEVRRRLANGDAAALRRQEAGYRRAIARGLETEEHYTAKAMDLLARASLLAAEEITAKRGGPAPRAASEPVGPSQRTPSAAIKPPLVADRSDRTPRPSPRPQVTRRHRPLVSPAPASTRVRPSPGVRSPERPLDVNEPFYLVRIGPISSARRASEIAGQLTLAGFAARVSRAEGGTRYMITLGPHRRSAADTIVKLVASRFGAGVPVAVNRVP